MVLVKAVTRNKGGPRPLQAPLDKLLSSHSGGRHESNTPYLVNMVLNASTETIRLIRDEEKGVWRWGGVGGGGGDYIAIATLSPPE